MESVGRGEAGCERVSVRAGERIRPGVVAAPSSGRGEAGVQLRVDKAFRGGTVPIRSGVPGERETRRVGLQFLLERVLLPVQHRQGRGASSRSVGLG